MSTNQGNSRHAGKGRGESVDNVDNVDAHFKSLAYNIRGIYTTLLQSLAIYLF